MTNKQWVCLYKGMANTWIVAGPFINSQLADAFGEDHAPVSWTVTTMVDPTTVRKKR
jgi:hypothetical protein